MNTDAKMNPKLEHSLLHQEQGIRSLLTEDWQIDGHQEALSGDYVFWLSTPIRFSRGPMSTEAVADATIAKIKNTIIVQHLIEQHAREVALLQKDIASLKALEKYKTHFDIEMQLKHGGG